MKFRITELLYRRIRTDFRVNLNLFILVMHYICLIDHNLNKNEYIKQLK